MNKDKAFDRMLLTIMAMFLIGLACIQVRQYLETREAYRAGLVQRVVNGETVWVKP